MSNGYLERIRMARVHDVAIESPLERAPRLSRRLGAGALPGLLSSVGSAWNISLFHDRNHGADHGRVVVGTQIPPADELAYRLFLAPWRAAVFRGPAFCGAERPVSAG